MLLSDDLPDRLAAASVSLDYVETVDSTVRSRCPLGGDGEIFGIVGEHSRGDGRDGGKVGAGHGAPVRMMDHETKTGRFRVPPYHWF